VDDGCGVRLHREAVGDAYEVSVAKNAAHGMARCPSRGTRCFPCAAGEEAPLTLVPLRMSEPSAGAPRTPSNRVRGADSRKISRRS
jgi:hypothetical protein